jgi:glycosyltransferase involved in cell wall biosynthesis
MAEGKRLSEPVRLLYVGRLERPKGVERCIGILERVARQGIRAELDLVGDGPERPAFLRQVSSWGLRESVHFHGWLPRTSLAPLYAKAHFLLFPATSSEGWPKALSEGMAYGAVPLAGSVSSIPQYLREFETGRAHDPLRLDEFVSSIAWYLAHPEEWERESANGMASAGQFGYDHYVERVRELLAVTCAPDRGSALGAAAPLRN